MNNTTADSFELIAKDAVSLLTAIVQDLSGHDEPEAKIAALLIGMETEAFCDRAIALGGV